jgi:acetyl esterase
MNGLDPQVSEFLRTLEARTAQNAISTEPLSAEEKIQMIRQSVSALGEFALPFERVLRTEEFDIPTNSGTLTIRFYYPQSSSFRANAKPVFVYYHGGGFVAGSLETHDTLLRAVANRAGCIVASVAYHLAPEHPYPAANNDAWAALKWVVKHAEQIRADANRIAVGGDSAGGLLAAWVAQKAAETGLPLSLQVLLYPNLDATTSMPSWEELGTGAYLLSHAQMLEWYDAYLPHGIDRKAPEVSPLFAPDLAGVSAALIVTADHDPLRDEGDAYAAKLKTAGVPVEHICWRGMIHGFASWAGALDASKMLIDHTARALRRAFVRAGQNRQIESHEASPAGVKA